MSEKTTAGESGPSNVLLADLQECKQRYEKCFVRIARSYGITTPLILVGMAKDNDENYAEILTRFVEEQQSKANATGTLDPIVRLRYPTAASKLSEIVAKLEEIDANPNHYCMEAVADARHDLAVLAASRLYKPNASHEARKNKEGN